MNLIKLCVGCPSPSELLEWQSVRSDPIYHVTRMWPKRADEILQGGSLYWVMAGEIQCRQNITGFEERIGEDGIRRCQINYSRNLIRVRPTPRRAFQGWRYLTDEDAPIDLEAVGSEKVLPSDLEAELSFLGIG